MEHAGEKIDKMLEAFRKLDKENLSDFGKGFCLTSCLRSTGFIVGDVFLIFTIIDFFVFIIKFSI